MNRRHLLAGAAAMPLAGMAADVQAFPHLTDDDPAVRAFHAWRAAWQADHEFVYASDDYDHDPEHIRLHDAEWEALTALAGTIATTPAGLVGQMTAALDLIGTMMAGGKLGDPDSYTFGDVKDDLDGKMLKSMLIGAQRLA